MGTRPGTREEVFQSQARRLTAERDRYRRALERIEAGNYQPANQAKVIAWHALNEPTKERS